MHTTFVEVLYHLSQYAAMEDCAFMRGDSFNGQFMTISGDGNIKNVLLVAALVPSEIADNYKYWCFSEVIAFAEGMLQKLSIEK